MNIFKRAPQTPHTQGQAHGWSGWTITPERRAVTTSNDYGGMGRTETRYESETQERKCRYCGFTQRTTVSGNAQADNNGYCGRLA